MSKSLVMLTFFFLFITKRALNVSKTDVSDSGLQWLCCGKNDCDFYAKRAAGCVLLESLFLRSTRGRITDIGIAFAISKLQNLKFIDFEHPLPTIVENSKGIVLPTATLEWFYCSGFGKFRVLNRLSLSPSVKTSHCIKKKRIWDLNLTEAEDTMTDFLDDWQGRPSITFAGGVVPYLSRFGKQSLQYLNLEFIDEVDPFWILRTFPNLKSLVFAGVMSYTSSVPYPPVSQLLQCFNYYGNPFNEEQMGSRELLLILMSPNMRELKIRNCYKLTDDILLNAFASHQFSKLERLELQRCDQISTRTFLRVFLNRKNHLKSVLVKNCLNILDVVLREH